MKIDPPRALRSGRGSASAPTRRVRRRREQTIGVSPGRASGTAFFEDSEPPDDGALLVVERADAPLLHVIRDANAVVADRGSHLSHNLRSSGRSLGIPAASA